MLFNGFTTVRDVGGATRLHRQATEEWLTPGPRLFIGGPVLSQTGGHGMSLPFACRLISLLGPPSPVCAGLNTVLIMRGS